MSRWRQASTSAAAASGLAGASRRISRSKSCRSRSGISDLVGCRGGRGGRDMAETSARIVVNHPEQLLDNDSLSDSPSSEPTVYDDLFDPPTVFNQSFQSISQPLCSLEKKKLKCYQARTPVHKNRDARRLLVS